MCGFDDAIGRYPVGIEAAHVRWHSQEGLDEIANALALCALHHALFDLGVLGITEGRRIRVSRLYVARNQAGLAVDALADQPLLVPALTSRRSTPSTSPGTTARSSKAP
jgi:putative restriction endonuclease